MVKKRAQRIMASPIPAQGFPPVGKLAIAASYRPLSEFDQHGIGKLELENCYEDLLGYLLCMKNSKGTARDAFLKHAESIQLCIVLAWPYENKLKKKWCRGESCESEKTDGPGS